MIKNVLIAFFLPVWVVAQPTIKYEISFDRAVHHEADIEMIISDLDSNPLEVRMSRTSPGRYALHEFAKNVYGVQAWNEAGEVLTITRPDPYSWIIKDHEGFVKLRYKLFANRGDGTYSQIDETHAHLNIPATFMYAPDYSDRPMEVIFNVREDLNWKIATQFKDLGNNRFHAPNLHYFMDSPVEIANLRIRQWEVESNGNTYNIRLAIHDPSSDEWVDQYTEKIKKVVASQKDVFGEYPDFDFGEYTFLACYMPNASGDGMEHRNSTVLSTTRTLEKGGLERNIGTVSHEFFHAWNVERLRPKSLEPFNYEKVNMSGELWIAEGFTSYYTALFLCRAGLISPAQYVEGLSGTLNYVINSPARKYFNPIEMSYQAPFTDAATSVDPVNRENYFISYYSYGSVLGLALDLSLRSMDNGLSMDGYMKAAWNHLGKQETPYAINDMKQVLAEYAGDDFATQFFNNYVYDSKMPDYKSLLASVGVAYVSQNIERVYIGSTISNENDRYFLVSNPREESPSYAAGLNKEDEIISINGKLIPAGKSNFNIFEEFKPGDTAKLVIRRFNKTLTIEITFEENPVMRTLLFEDAEMELSEEAEERRKQWLK